MRPLENAIVRLLKARPFYGHFLLHFRRERGAGPAPLGVTLRSGTPTLYVHEEGFCAFSPQEQQALLEHALKHVLHLHPLRRRERHGLSWDIACDLAINPTIAGLPSRAATPERFGLQPGLAAEEYYRLLARPFDTGNLEGEGVGNAGREAGEYRWRSADEPAPTADEPAASPTLDDHRVWSEADATPEGLAAEVVRSLVREAWQVSRGEVPGDVRPLVEGWLASAPIPWSQVLRQFVATVGRVGRQSTWKRSHRRFGRDTPGYGKRRRLNLLIGVDISDSTEAEELREAFARELVRIARGRDSRITVLYAGSRIQKIASFASSEAVAEVYHGGGFTDLRPVFAYARTLQPRPAAVIYLTDGFGEAPEAMEFPTLWVLTQQGRKPAPWGVTLHLEK